MKFTDIISVENAGFLMIGMVLGGTAVVAGFNDNSGLPPKDEVEMYVAEDFKSSTGLGINNISLNDSRYPSFYSGKIEASNGNSGEFYVSKSGLLVFQKRNTRRIEFSKNYVLSSRNKSVAEYVNGSDLS